MSLGHPGGSFRSRTNTPEGLCTIEFSHGHALLLEMREESWHVRGYNAQDFSAVCMFVSHAHVSVSHTDESCLLFILLSTEMERRVLDVYRVMTASFRGRCVTADGMM